MGLSRNYIIGISIIGVLVALMVHNYYTKKKSLSYDAFQINDTSLVVSLSIHGKLDTLQLEKRNGKWIDVQGSFPVSKRIETFLTLMKRVEVKSFLNDELKRIYLDSIQQKGVYVEWQDRNGKSKNFYFFENSNETINSFIYNKELDKMFLVKSLGFNGSLKPFFNPKPSNWVSHILFSYKPANIKSIEVDYAVNQEYYRVVRNSGYDLLDQKGNNLYNNPENIQRYFTYFNLVRYTEEVQDISLASLEAHKIASIAITNTGNLQDSYIIYRLPLDNNNGFDMNLALVFSENKKKLYKVKYIDIDLLLKDVMYFK